jgi:hypothetical protein
LAGVLVRLVRLAQVARSPAAFALESTGNLSGFLSKEFL